MSRSREFYQAFTNLSPLDAYAFAHEMTHQLQTLLPRPEDANVGMIMTAMARSFEMLGLALWENVDYSPDDCAQDEDEEASTRVVSFYVTEKA